MGSPGGYEASYLAFGLGPDGQVGSGDSGPSGHSAVNSGIPVPELKIPCDTGVKSVADTSFILFQLTTGLVLSGVQVDTSLKN